MQRRWQVVLVWLGALAVGLAAGCGTSSVANAKPDFSLTATGTSVSVTAGGSAQTVSVAATALNGFSGTVQVTVSGVPAGVTASPVTFTLTPGTPQTVSFSASSAASATTSTVQFSGTAAGLTHSAPITLTVKTPVVAPDFSLTTNTASLTVTAGGTAQTVSVAATALNGFSGTVQVTVSGVPAGVTASPATFTLTPGTPQTVNLTAAATAAATTATVLFSGTAASLRHTAPVALTVKAQVAATPGVDVTTYHFDVGRTGLNPNETTLTPAVVISTKFGLLRVLPVDSKVDAQPLYLSSLTAGGQQRNVVYVVTEHDSVYAFDADTGAQIWKTSILGANETTSGDHGCSQISPEIGITSTPVIDRKAGANGTIFVVGMSLDGGGAYHQRLHALDITTGAELAGSPTEIHATYPGTGANSSGGNVVFDPSQYAERAGLLLLNGTVYLGWTSHCDQGAYTGWLMAYSETTLAQTSVLNLTPNGSEGSIWMAGAGLAADASGNVYFLDANGTFDATLDGNGLPVNHDFGNGFLKVSTTAGSLAVADYFEMYNTGTESDGDEDLGSGGALVLPDMTDTAGTVHHLAVGAGKDAKIYVVNRDAMGKFNAQNNSALYQEIDGAIGGVWSMPAYFNNTVYYGAVSDTLKAFPITNAKLATSATVQSTNQFAYPGTTPAISANGTAGGIVWAVENTSPAVLHAYDATTLQELYDSNQATGGRDQFGNGNKFITPMIANGKVFVGTPSGVAEFGLLP
jgi:PQQ enzyme repeat